MQGNRVIDSLTDVSLGLLVHTGLAAVVQQKMRTCMGHAGKNRDKKSSLLVLPCQEA